MDNRIVEKHGFSKLPLEVIGLVLKKLDGDNQVGELKKCKLVSPRLYKATQDVFQEEFDGKLCTHFNGFELNFTRSRTFGMNIFGSYKLNFPIVKISRAEYYLMNKWLEKLIPTNIQTLELKDNLLNWMEIIDVLAKFPKITKLKYIQSSDDMIVADKIYNLFSVNDEVFHDFFMRMIVLIQVKPAFLSQLKIFETEVIHWNISNILSLVVAYSQCQNLEKFAINIDLFGISKSECAQSFLRDISSPKFKMNEFQMNSLYTLARFVRSMKSISIIIDDSKLPPVKTIFLNEGYTDIIQKFIFMSTYSILRHFSIEELIQFDQLESIILKSPLLHYGTYLKNNFQLSEFINKQKNLENFEISHLECEFLREDTSAEPVIQFLNNLKVHGNKARIGYQVDIKGRIQDILQLSENLSSLKVILLGFYTTWKFSDQNIPKYPNCFELRMENYNHQNWDHFECQSIVEKFQNLEKLIIWTRNWEIGPKV